MIRGLYTGASGMLAESTRTDVIANNLANVNTAGFKKDVAITKDFASMLISRVNDGEVATVGDVGLGTVIDEVATIHSNGAVRMTGNDFDMAIEGKGFFAVQTKEGIRYTRNGTFGKNLQGQLITTDGYPVLGQNGPIRIEQGKKMVVSTDGGIVIDGKAAGKLQMVEFDDEKQLQKEGANLFNIAAGQTPQKATGGVKQGFLEMANVNVVGEMVNLISNYRAYEINGKVVQSHDQLIGKAVNDVGRL